MMNENLDPQTDERLSAYLDDELSVDERAEFEAILAARDDYQEALARMRRTRSDFQDLPLQQLSETAHQQILDRVAEARQATPETQGRGWRIRSLAIAATLAASFLLAVTLFPRSQDRQLAQAERTPAADHRDRLTRATETEGEPAGAAITRSDSDAPASGEGPLPRGREAVASGRVPTRSPSEAATDFDHEESAAESVGTESVVTDGLGRGERRAGLRVPPLDETGERPPAPMAVAASPSASAPSTNAPSTRAPGSTVPSPTPANDVLTEWTTDTRIRAADLPEIIIQANNQQGYDFLLASLAQARLDAEQPEDAVRQQGYFDAQAQIGRQQEMPPQVQVLEVTSTPSDMAQLVQSAQTQGAVLLNAVMVQQQLPELNENPIENQPLAFASKAGKEESGWESDRGSFQGVINNWIQVAPEPSQEEIADAWEGAAVAGQRQLQQIELQQPRRNEATRWRIKILPHAEGPALPAPTPPEAPSISSPPPG